MLLGFIVHFQVATEPMCRTSILIDRAHDSHPLASPKSIVTTGLILSDIPNTNADHFYDGQYQISYTPGVKFTHTFFTPPIYRSEKTPKDITSRQRLEKQHTRETKSYLMVMLWFSARFGTLWQRNCQCVNKLPLVAISEGSATSWCLLMSCGAKQHCVWCIK